MFYLFWRKKYCRLERLEEVQSLAVRAMSRITGDLKASLLINAALFC